MMIWMILILLLVLVVTLRICAALSSGISKGDPEKEEYLEILIRNSEHSED
jgi:hypothetical protein